ncbi:hypothetical protein KY284_020460 [Solanum tuberosum]|nr:hypothetical protein KY284_020460 [Solanum tuberosum]
MMGTKKWNLNNLDGWDYGAMQDVFPEHVIEHVRDTMRFGQFENVMDKLWWTKNSTGKFTTKSALEISRQRVDVHVSTLLHLWNPNISEDCGCCNSSGNSKLREVFKVLPIILFWVFVEKKKYHERKNNRTTSVTRIVKWVPPPNPWFKETLMVPQEGTLESSTAVQGAQKSSDLQQWAITTLVCKNYDGRLIY